MSISIFDNLLFISQNQNTPNNQLRCCLKIIAKHIKTSERCDSADKISTADLENSAAAFGIKLHALTLNASNNPPKSSYPLLIETKACEQFWVLFKKNNTKAVVYNSLHNKKESIKLDSISAINRAWECIPGQLPRTSCYLDLIQFTFRFFKARLFISACLGALVAITTLLISMLSGLVLTHFLERGANHFFSILAAVSLFSAGTAGFFYASSLWMKTINADILSLILPNAIAHIFHLPMHVINQFISTDISERLSDYELSIANIVKTSLAFVFSCTGLVVLLFYMGYCHVQLALFYLAIGLIFLLIKVGLFPRSLRNLHVKLDEHSKLNAFLVEILLQIQKIRSANAEIVIFNQWFHKLIQSKLFSELAIKIDISLLTLDSAFPAALLFCFYSTLYFSPTGIASYNLIQFMVAAGQFAIIFQKLSSELTLLVQLLPGLKRLDPLLSEKIESYQLNKSTIDFKQQLTLSHVYFHHRENGSCILKDVSLTIPAGKFVALVGRSGAGKSSVFRLLLGLELKSSGNILIDNENIECFNMKDIRRQFGVVLQTTSLFPGSIFSNISATANITVDEAWNLATMVGLDEDIKAMPMKMFTYISDNASESLSGGQKQKILIARALATKPTILLLDEATSALDNESQAIVHQNLARLKITRVVIAHRYSTIIDADMIYVMEKGKIIDSGNYPQLMQRNKLTGNEWVNPHGA